MLLYELLTGALPFDLERLKQAGYGEILRIIREEEPAKPSTKVSTLAGTTASVAACRRTEPGKLGALLRGELDWIVMKTLEKERARRYETADALAADVQRYLDDEPVLAGAPSRVYRARKFVRRHRVGVSIGAAVVLLLGTGLAGTGVGLVRANHASARARQHTLDAQRKFELARKGAELISNVDLGLAGGTRALRRSLAEAVLKYSEKLGAEQQSDLNETIRIRDSYSSLSRACLDLDDIPLAKQACEHHREIAARLASEFPDSPMVKLDASYSLALYASIARKQGDFASALEKDEQALQTLGSESDWKTYPATTKRMIAWTHQELALARFNQSEFKAAREHFTQARDKYAELVRLGNPQWFDRMDLGRAYASLGTLAVVEEGARVEDAEQHLAEAQKIVDALQGERPNDPGVLMFAGEVTIERGHVFERKGNYREASKSYATALELAERLAAEDPRYPAALMDVCVACSAAALTGLALGELELVERLCARALGASQLLLEVDPENPASTLARVEALQSAATLAQRKGERDKQESFLSSLIVLGEKLDAQRPKDRNAPVMLAPAQSLYGRLELDRRRADLAEEHFSRELTYARRALDASPDSHAAQKSLAGAWADMGEAAWLRGTFEKGMELSGEALQLCAQLESAEPNNPDFRRAESSVRQNLGRCALALGNSKQAREHFEVQRRINQEFESARPNDSEISLNLSYVLLDLTSVAMAEGLLDEARAHNAEARARLEKLAQKDASNTRVAWQLTNVERNSGMIEMGGGHWNAALRAFQSDLERCVRLAGQDPIDSQGQDVLGQLYENMGAASAHLGNVDDARSFTRRAIELRCKLAASPTATVHDLNEYALLLVTCTPDDLRDARTAVACAEQGVRQTRRTDPGLLDTLASAQFVDGQLQEAVKTQEDALRVLGDSPSRRRGEFENRLALYRAALAAKEAADTAKESPK